MRKIGLQPLRPGSTTEDLNFKSLQRDIQKLMNHFVTGKIVGPTATDDYTKGHDVGTLWVDEAADLVYCCVDNSAGAAVWKLLG